MNSTDRLSWVVHFHRSLVASIKNTCTLFLLQIPDTSTVQYHPPPPPSLPPLCSSQTTTATTATATSTAAAFFYSSAKSKGHDHTLPPTTPVQKDLFLPCWVLLFSVDEWMHACAADGVATFDCV